MKKKVLFFSNSLQVKKESWNFENNHPARCAPATSYIIEKANTIALVDNKYDVNAAGTWISKCALNIRGNKNSIGNQVSICFKIMNPSHNGNITPFFCKIYFCASIKGTFRVVPECSWIIIMNYKFPNHHKQIALISFRWWCSKASTRKD